MSKTYDDLLLHCTNYSLQLTSSNHSELERNIFRLHSSTREVVNKRKRSAELVTINNHHKRAIRVFGIETAGNGEKINTQTGYDYGENCLRAWKQTDSQINSRFRNRERWLKSRVITVTKTNTHDASACFNFIHFTEYNDIHSTVRTDAAYSFYHFGFTVRRISTEHTGLSKRGRTGEIEGTDLQAWRSLRRERRGAVAVPRSYRDAAISGGEGGRGGAYSAAGANGSIRAGR